jgi:PAS domain S-box-containing protein
MGGGAVGPSLLAPNREVGMSLVLIISILIRLVAAVWSVVLLRQIRDWRMGFLTVMLGLMALRQTLTLLEERVSWNISMTGDATEIPGLVVSFMAFLAVFFLERIIRERKRAEEIVARFGRIIEDSVGEVYLFAADTLRFILVNRGARENLGYSMEELRNLTPLDIKPEFNAESLAKVLESLLTGREKEARVRTVHRRKDGTTYPVEGHIQLSSTESSPVFVGMLLDMSEKHQAEEGRKKLEVQLRHFQKLETMGTLAGGLAHDFANIITPILGHAQMALNEAEPGSRSRNNMEHVLAGARRARDLVDQVLTFSRRAERERKPVQVHPIVEDTLQLARASFPPNVEIRQSLDKGCRLVMGDVTEIHQLLMNLCTNAVHAMRGKGGVLEVGLGMFEADTAFVAGRPHLHEGTYVRLSVSDTGHGMDRATLDRIFEPFFTTTGDGGGTGLGLAVVYGIVSSYGGGITVESEVGKGTTFCVYLPPAEPVAPGGA